MDANFVLSKIFLVKKWKVWSTILWFSAPIISQILDVQDHVWYRDPSYIVLNVSEALNTNIDTCAKTNIMIRVISY